MIAPNEPLSTSILVLMYFGDAVFAVSGALTAARYRMDILGFILIGTITGIGGGTTRDLLLGRTVWWTQDPTELILCVVASLITFFFIQLLHCAGVTLEARRSRASDWVAIRGQGHGLFSRCHGTQATLSPRPAGGPDRGRR